MNVMFNISQLLYKEKIPRGFTWLRLQIQLIDLNCKISKQILTHNFEILSIKVGFGYFGFTLVMLFPHKFK